jgi:hypothetical protein
MSKGDGTKRESHASREVWLASLVFICLQFVKCDFDRGVEKLPSEFNRIKIWR